MKKVGVHNLEENIWLHIYSEGLKFSFSIQNCWATDVNYLKQLTFSVNFKTAVDKMMFYDIVFRNIVVSGRILQCENIVHESIVFWDSS